MQFLDSQRINNLIEYLEELHEHDKATVDHTTLLLNCYAKLKNTEKLETFIKSGTNFDLDTAISMCRQGGYYDQAVFLAKKHGEHEIVVDILIEDSRKYDDALDYIWRLGADLAYPLLMRYARVLLEHCPKDSTQLFIDYYTGAYQPRKRPVEGMQDAAAVTGPSAVQNLTSFIPLPYRQASVAPSPAPGGTLQVTNQKVDANVATTAKTAEDYDVPKPRTAFSSFVDHPQEFIVFLEACLGQKDIQESDRTDLYTTLFELYLETANSRKGLDREEWEAKAKRLVDRRVVSSCQSCPCSPSHVCRIPSMHRTYFYYLISPIFVTVLPWFVSSKVFVSTSLDRIHLPMIPSGQSKRSGSMALRSHNCTQQHWHISHQVRKCLKKPATSSTPS